MSRGFRVSDRIKYVKFMKNFEQDVMLFRHTQTITCVILLSVCSFSYCCNNYVNKEICFCTGPLSVTSLYFTPTLFATYETFQTYLSNIFLKGYTCLASNADGTLLEILRCATLFSCFHPRNCFRFLL